MKSEIMKYCIERGILLDKDVGEILSGLEDGEVKKIIEKMALFKGKIITKTNFSESIGTLKSFEGEKYFEKLCIDLGMRIEISREIERAKDKEEERESRRVKVIYSSPNQTKKIEVEDFVKYFRARYQEIRRVLQERHELENLVSINKISGRGSFSIIGLVYEKRVTKNKNLLLGVEDLTGRISVLVNQNKSELYDIARDVVVDSVIGIKGGGSREMMFANEVFFPDAMLREKVNLERDESAAFISDTHVGSKMFLESNFLKFIEWINGESGNEKQKEEARRVKYLFVTGDTIDGIGVYPGQENLLNIRDVIEQYKKLAGFFRMIRKDVTIILCPGQHDAVRVAEPQPVLGKEYAFPLHEIDNLILVSNPAIVEIGGEGGRRGFRVMMYHGASMVHVLAEVDSLRGIRAHDTPSKIVKYLLKIRHLSPIHSAVTYIPNEKEDSLIIREVPDVITTADLHRSDVDIYNNVLIICSSCWQSTTPFEEKVGNHPDPCKVPVLNLKTRQIKIMDFSDALEENKAPAQATCDEKEGAIVCQVNGEKKI